MRGWSTHRKLLFLAGASGGSAVEYTATGNPVSFVTDLAKPLRKLLCAWTPTQSGTGDPAPDNVRPITGMDGVNVWQTGKNLLTNNEVKSEGNQFFLCASSISYPFHLVPGTYTLSHTGKLAFAYYKKVGGGGVLIHGNSVNYGTFTITEECDCQIWYYTSGATASDFTDIQLEVGSSATTYEAPQGGTTYAVEFPALGKNLFDKSTTIYNAIISSQEIYETANGRIAYVPCLPNTTYTISKVATTRAVIAYATTEGIPQKGDMVYGGIDYRNDTSASITTGADAKWLVLYLTNVGYDQTPIETVLDSVMLNVGSTATPYEPYTSTVYGGTLDLTTGVLTAEWKKRSLANFDTFNRTTEYAHPFFYGSCNDRTPGRTTDFMCDVFKKDTVNVFGFNFGGNAEDNSISFSADVNSHNVYMRDDSCETRKAFLEKHANDCVVYLLAEPITFQLTPRQVSALIGNNTIWSDANGDCEVKYLKKG